MENILNVVLLGKTGAGKSSTGNTILGQKAFVSRNCSKSITQDVIYKSGTVGDLPIKVYDTPGLFDTNMREEKIKRIIEQVLQECESGPCVYLLVIKAERFTNEERKTVEKIEELLGENRLQKTWILFTRGDQLEEENKTIGEFVNETETLKKLIQKYNHRCHVFNNKRLDIEQVQTLFLKILPDYILEEEIHDIVKANPLMRKTPRDFEQALPVSDLSSRRIVLLGKSGAGKSAAGNTILGNKEFVSVMRMSSVTSKCSIGQATVSGRSVSVVDTPGFFDTRKKPEEYMKEIMKSVYISSPGPHAFLIVFPANMRFTEHEQQIPQLIEMFFGQEVLKYSIILFTHGDQLEEPIEDLINENCALRDLVQQCGGRYHVFNNRYQNNREQVNDLLQKIDTMIEKSGGGYYSNKMFEDALRFKLEEEKKRNQKEEEERKQQEERKRQVQIYRLEKTGETTSPKSVAQLKPKQESVKDSGRPEEDTNSGFKGFFSKYKKLFCIGFAVGAVIGVIAGGAVGLCIGGAAGGIAGGLLAVVCGAIEEFRKGVKVEKRRGEDGT